MCVGDELCELRCKMRCVRTVIVEEEATEEEKEAAGAEPKTKTPYSDEEVSSLFHQKNILRKVQIFLNFLTLRPSPEAIHSSFSFKASSEIEKPAQKSINPRKNIETI